MSALAIRNCGRGWHPAVVAAGLLVVHLGACLSLPESPSPTAASPQDAALDGILAGDANSSAGANLSPDAGAVADATLWDAAGGCITKGPLIPWDTLPSRAHGVCSPHLTTSSHAIFGVKMMGVKFNIKPDGQPTYGAQLYLKGIECFALVSCGSVGSLVTGAATIEQLDSDPADWSLVHVPAVGAVAPPATVDMIWGLYYAATDPPVPADFVGVCVQLLSHATDPEGAGARIRVPTDDCSQPFAEVTVVAFPPGVDLEIPGD